MRRHICVVCGKETLRERDRATCGDPTCYSIHKSNVMQRVSMTTNPQNWTKELRPWLEGIQFPSVVEPEQPVFLGKRPGVTHVHTESSAAWAPI